MKILCTNDDGIHARGLDLLVEVCAGAGEVYVVAPDREQSGASHSLTLHRPLRGMARGVLEVLGIRRCAPKFGHERVA